MKGPSDRKMSTYVAIVTFEAFGAEDANEVCDRLLDVARSERRPAQICRTITLGRTDADGYSIGQ